MAEDRYALFIEELIKLTKRATIHWDYLDSEPALYEGMSWTNESTNLGLFASRDAVRPDFDTENSFFSKVNGTYVVLLVQGGKPATLYVVPNTYKKVVSLAADKYGELITRLLNLVQSQFPDGENFISELLSKGSKN
jgi:hypothetical protein